MRGGSCDWGGRSKHKNGLKSYLRKDTKVTANHKDFKGLDLRMVVVQMEDPETRLE